MTKEVSMIDFLKECSKKKLLLITIGVYVAYFCLAILGPVLTVCIKYDLFNSAESKTKINGFALIIIIIIAIVSLVLLKKAVAKIRDVSKGACYFKYILETVSNLVFPVMTLVVVYLMNVNFSLASSTMIIVCIFYILAELLNGLVINFVDRENRIRQDSLYDKEKAARTAKL